jgi:hypothetical protein
MFRSYIHPKEREKADKALPRLMTEGLFLGGSGLGVLALIFEIAADAFSVAAYQTLLALEGASGNHQVAIIAFSILSALLFLGVVPAYKAAAYLRPDAGGSGPLVEAIGPANIRWASWVGTSLFFLDAILTIIISSISAADVTMLILPEWSNFRIFLAELYAIFIMGVLVLLGPKRAVPLFLLGGGAFTIFTIFALGYVGINALVNPGLREGTDEIIHRLETSGIIEEIHVVGKVLFFQSLLHSMSSAMLGFSGYEVIPASGKHAARPKWKVINTALTLAAIFLISTGIIQLFAASVWKIPPTIGYSTLLIEYELVFGETALLTIAGVLLAIILLLAQGGGYVGGAAVAANAARLGRLPSFFLDDRIGIAVIWGIAAALIPVIRLVTVVEAYYAFGFVSAFVITSTTVYFVRDDALINQNIDPNSQEAKSIRFAGLRGMIASYGMMIVLISQKTEALLIIATSGALITALQVVVSRGGMANRNRGFDPLAMTAQNGRGQADTGLKRAHEQARQRGIVELVANLNAEGAFTKFNVEPDRIYRLISCTHHIDRELWLLHGHDGEHHHEDLPEPSLPLEGSKQRAMAQREHVLKTVEHYSHYGIFTFIHKYSHNWESPKRDQKTVERAMVRALFPNTPFDEVWTEFEHYEWKRIPEDIWQFCRLRYQWAKDQWPNLSDQITTIWTIQDLLDHVNGEKTVEKFVTLLRSHTAEDLAGMIKVPPHHEENAILARDLSEEEEITDVLTDEDLAYTVLHEIPASAKPEIEDTDAVVQALADEVAGNSISSKLNDEAEAENGAAIVGVEVDEDTPSSETPTDEIETIDTANTAAGTPDSAPSQDTEDILTEDTSDDSSVEDAGDDNPVKESPPSDDKTD